MPRQALRSATKTSSDLHCINMGPLAHDTDDMGSAVYHIMGMKELGNEVSGTPWFLSLLSSLLERSVHRNEMSLGTAQITDVLTVFHGLRAPPVSIQQYIHRIFKYAGCSPSCFIVAYIYVDRYLQCTDAHLTSLNVHRLLITSITIAAKFIDDAFFNNAYYAKVGGVSTLEMNRLEMKLLFSIDFRLKVSTETFRRYCLQLEKEAGGCWIDRPINYFVIKESWSTKDDSTCSTTVAR
ncbi:hypothetical protein Nepgr_032863 [Nepenthes gracilis]|uniref:Cyclin n=1 Tax=Nepenthes gracilis TaxID=150966 RepID=A0AAD3Y800_NEPGR|nr:hypothetical protein Nepgr_032863 [Nepenthes gracilis]